MAQEGSILTMMSIEFCGEKTKLIQIIINIDK